MKLQLPKIGETWNWSGDDEKIVNYVNYLGGYINLLINDLYPAQVRLKSIYHDMIYMKYRKIK